MARSIQGLIKKFLPLSRAQRPLFACILSRLGQSAHYTHTRVCFWLRAQCPRYRGKDTFGTRSSKQTAARFSSPARSQHTSLSLLTNSKVTPRRLFFFFEMGVLICVFVICHWACFITLSVLIWDEIAFFHPTHDTCLDTLKIYGQ